MTIYILHVHVMFHIEIEDDSVTCMYFNHIAMVEVYTCTYHITAPTNHHSPITRGVFSAMDTHIPSLVHVFFPA